MAEVGPGLIRALLRHGADSVYLGLGFQARRFRRRGADTRVRIRRVGPMTLRPGTSDADVISQVFTQRQYDLSGFQQASDIQSRYQDILARGKRPLIVDLGANIGASSLWFALRYPEATIVAVEPDEENARLAAANTAGRNVEVLTAAIGSRPGRVSLSEGVESWAISTERAEGGAVEVVTMPEILEQHADLEPFLVKIDIEGFEDDLFADSTAWVNRFPLIMLEPHDWLYPDRHSSRNFQRVMGALSYDLLLSGENVVYLRED